MVIVVVVVVVVVMVAVVLARAAGGELGVVCALGQLPVAVVGVPPAVLFVVDATSGSVDVGVVVVAFGIVGDQWGAAAGGVGNDAPDAVGTAVRAPEVVGTDAVAV